MVTPADVAFFAKVTFAGRPVKSAAVAPPRYAYVNGIVSFWFGFVVSLMPSL